MEAPNQFSAEQRQFSEQSAIPVSETVSSGAASTEEGLKPLSRFRLAIWGLWLFYAIAVTVLCMRVFSTWGVLYGLALSLFSGPGAVALLFWKPKTTWFISKRLYLQFGNLTVVSFFCNFFLFYAVFKHFVSDDGALVSMVIAIVNSLLHGGLAWLVFFKKEAPYLIRSFEF